MVRYKNTDFNIFVTINLNRYIHHNKYSNSILQRLICHHQYWLRLLIIPAKTSELKACWISSFIQSNFRDERLLWDGHISCSMRTRGGSFDATSNIWTDGIRNLFVGRFRLYGLLSVSFNFAAIVIITPYQRISTPNHLLYIDLFFTVTYYIIWINSVPVEYRVKFLWEIWWS